ncbi:NUDIX hydrolase [candidate division KSB1 bacterium]|nr:NUDIX hydrolase [candidate division KSB1 bacterium]
MKKSPVLAVRMIICDTGGHILFLQRDHAEHGQGQWCLPGGKVDYGYTVEKTLAKELKEETSLELVKSRFLFFQENVPPNSENEEHYLVLYYECQVQGDILLNGESSDYRWVAKQELGQLDIAFRNDQAVKKYYEIQTLQRGIN